MRTRAGFLFVLLGCVLPTTGCPPQDTPPRGDGTCAIEFTDQGTVRVLVVGHAFRPDDALSYRSFERSYLEDMPEIEDCLSQSRPNLVVFPEDAGLIAWFIGQRALLARGAKDSATAFNAAFAGYHRRADAYVGRFPGISSSRALTLALSDTAWRAMDRTFGGIARTYGVWVVTSMNLPDAALTHDPELIARFGDPEVPASEGAYVARSPEVHNMALLYGPDGKRQGRVDKVFLTDPEEQALDLSNGSFERTGVLTTPFAKIGAAISRDAFYAPFMQRMEDLGVELVVQPEAFSGWTVAQADGDWLPDVFVSSAWSHTQKYAGLRHNATPILAGNLYELIFDGQTSITQKSAPGQPQRAYVGSQPLGGFVQIGAWVDGDDPSRPLDERRGLLRARGAALAPGSGEAEEGAYADTVIGADLWFGEEARRPHPVTPAGGVTTISVAPGMSGAQTNPDVAAHPEGGACAVWSDGRHGPARVYYACSAPDGRTWAPARPVEALGTARQLRPSIAISPSSKAIVVAWQEEADGVPAQVRFALKADGQPGFSAGGAVDNAAGGQWEPDIAFSADGTEATVVWTDFREGLAPRVRQSRSQDGGRSWSVSSWVDPLGPRTARYEGTQVQPTVAYAPGGAVVAWLDYRDRDWKVWAAASVNGVFGAPVRVTPEDAHENLGSDPQLAPTAKGVAIAWDDLRQRRAHHDVRAARYVDGVWQQLGAPPKGAEAGAWLSRFRPAIAARDDGNLEVVFQDLSSQKSALVRGTVLAGEDAFAAQERLDDTADAANQLARPRLASTPNGIIAVFEDDREGERRIWATVPF